VSRTFSTIAVMIVMSTMISAVVRADELIDTKFMVPTVKAELYLRVRGVDRSNPVILYLHGGPGEMNGPLLFQAYAGPLLEKHFVVAYLHQRHTCMSPEAPLNTLTIGQFIKDVDTVVEYLKDEFNQDAIFLIGHSFGGALGYLYLLEHDENIAKLVSAGGAFSTTSIEINGYETVMKLAIESENQVAVTQLENVGPPPYETLQGGMVWRMVAMSILDARNEGLSKNLNMSEVMSITGIHEFDVGWQKKFMDVAGMMWTELSTIDLVDDVKNIKTPMLLIAGAKDIMVPFSILEAGFTNYGGEKQYIILENSNHMMFADEPELFTRKVIEFFLE